MNLGVHGIDQVESIFNSKVIILSKQPLKLLLNSTALNFSKNVPRL